ATVPGTIGPTCSRGSRKGAEVPPMAAKKKPKTEAASSPEPAKPPVLLTLPVKEFNTADVEALAKLGEDDLRTTATALLRLLSLALEEQEPRLWRALWALALGLENGIPESRKKAEGLGVLPLWDAMAKADEYGRKQGEMLSELTPREAYDLA